MPGNRQYAWFTTAIDEETAIQAAVLGKSLERVITTAETFVFISQDVIPKFRLILAQCFDHVIPVPLEEKYDKENLQKMDNLKLFAMTMEMHTKIIIVNPNNLILQNCDELFHLEKDCYTTEMYAGNSTLPSVFVARPDSEMYRKIIKLLHSRKFSLLNLLTDPCGLSCEETVGQLSTIYSADIDGFQNHNKQELEKLKIISYKSMTKITANDDPSTLIITKLWTSLWVEIQQQQSNHDTIEFPLRIKKDRPKQNRRYHDAIAIVGHSCRFPESNNSDEFWNLLISGADGIGSTPIERLELLQVDGKKIRQFKAGFLKCPIEEFDAKFFGISPREAELIDPQQRLLLEVAWEALENAAIDPHSLKGGNTGVFTGVWQADYEKIVKENTPTRAFHNVVLGNSFSATSARISYFLGLNGPNIATESGCSSSLVALHLACESLKRKETDLGLVMGANLIIVREADADVPILAKDGHCKTFDEKADGFGRAEGIAVIVLKRLSDTIKTGDRIMGIIRGSGISNEGTTSSFGTPSKICQEIAVRDALRNSGVRPEEVDYVEAHGTGTPVGDPVEFAALSAGYAGKREKPLIIGSVKTNIGHCESAAGLAGLIKVILSMKHETIPPHRNFDTLNPYINLEAIPAILPLEQLPWKRDEKRVRIAGVSSFGISGTNLHFLVEEPPRENKCRSMVLNSLEADKTHHILNLSAKTENALDDLVNRCAKYVEDNSKIDINDLTYTANNCRAHFQYRFSVTGKDISQFADALKSKSSFHPVLKEQPKIAFLFTGQGSQYLGMAHDLYKSNSIFRNAFDKCAMIIEGKTGIALKDVLWNQIYGSELLECVSCQLSIFTVQYALLSLMHSLGVKPDFVLGHSVGEYSAAVASGIIGLEDALVVLIKRSQLIAELPAGGMMAVSCSKEKAEELISNFSEKLKGEWVDIAVINSSEEIVVAAKHETLAKFQEFCANNNIRFKALAASHAFHSREIDGILNLFEIVTKAIKYKNPNFQYVSGTTGSLLTMDEMSDGKYWLRHAREPVNFEKGMHTLAENGCNTFIEIGPRPILLALGMACLTSVQNMLWLPILQQNKDNWEVLLESLGKLYMNGVDINWSSIDTPGNRKKLELPTYPFQRQKYWINVPEKNEAPEVHALLGKKVSLASIKETVYQNTRFSLADFPYIRDHQVANLMLMPGAGFLEIILAAGKDLLQIRNNWKTNLLVKDFVIEAAFEVEEGKRYKMQVIAIRSENNDDSLAVNLYVFNKLNGWKKHASALLSLFDDPNVELSFGIQNIENIKSRCGERKSSTDFYKEIQKSGIYFGETFQSIESAWSSENESLAVIPLASLPANSEGYIIHPIILDAMLQATALTMDVKDSNLYLPISIENCVSFGNSFSDVVFAHALWDEKKNSGSVELYNEQNDLLFVMRGVRLVQTTIGSVLNAISGQKNSLPSLYQEILVPRLGPLQSRINLKKLPEFCEVMKPLEKAMENDMKSFNAGSMKLQNKFIHLKLINMLNENGVFLEMGMEYTTRAIMVNNFISLAHNKLLDRIIDMFVEDGNIVRHEIYDNWKVVKQFPAGAQFLCEIEKLHNELKIVNPMELEILEKCLDNLWNVITGKVKPVAALFGRADMNILDIYTKGLYVKLANIRMAKFVAYILNDLKLMTSSQEVATVRIIEIGGGSAASSKEILTSLEENGISCQYTFTDISSQFFENAKKELSSFAMVDYKVLDIEKDPSTQGFCPNHYDIVVASNVIHATTNLNTSIGNVRRLLIDGGVLVLQEIIKPSRLIDLIFGILDSYWKFNDYDLRTSNPMVSQQTWDRVFANNQFEFSHILSNKDEWCSVMVAKALKSDIQRDNDTTDIACVQEIQTQRVWLLFCDDGLFYKPLLKKFANIGQHVITLYHGQNMELTEKGSTIVNMLDDTLFEKNLLQITESKEICGVVYLMSLDCDGRKEKDELFNKTLTFCKYFSKNTLMNTKVLVATRGVVFTTNQETVLPPGAIIWGMLKSLIHEVPKLSVTLVDLDPDTVDIEKDIQEIFFEVFNSDENFACYRKGKKFVPRMVKFSEQMEPLILPKGGYEIQVPKSKRIADVSFKVRRNCQLAPNDVEVVVKAMSLNFRDIFVIMKPDGYQTLYDEVGSDFSGIVSNVGSNVTKFKTGDEVFGFGRGTAASHIVQKENDVIFHKPSHFNLFEAATIPACHLTAHYCLVTIADLKKNETVLIHVASGGVGLYAIQIAQYIGARIVATAGSHRKRSYLRSLGLENVFHSRDLTFGEEIKRVTNGHGVDVVLNSLTSKGFKETTLENCAKNARFVEIGKVNIWEPEDVQKLRPDVVYTIADLEKVDPNNLRCSMEIVYKKEIIKPVAYSRFDVTNIRNALNYFMKAEHIGKIVLSMPELSNVRNHLVAQETLFNKNATYLITGGLGGIGLVVAKWMADSGAGCLVLIGRSAPSAETVLELGKLRSKGCLVFTYEVDIGNLLQCENLFHKICCDNSQFPPLKGVIHSAGVISDATFANQTWEKYQPVFNAKVHGCLNLHKLTKGINLEHFVLFSSVAANIAPIGQSNHTAANAFLDAFAHYRHSIGLAAQSINWGAWSEVGAAINVQHVGIYPFNPKQGIAALQFLMMRPNLVQIGVLQADMKGIGHLTPMLERYFEDFLVEGEGYNMGSDSVQSEKFWEDMKSLTVTDRVVYIKKILVNLITETLKLRKGEIVNEHQSFSEMGFDSLMSVELKNKLQLLMGDNLVLNSTTLMDYSTISTLSEYLAEATLGKMAVKSETKIISVNENELKDLIKQDSILPDDIKGSGHCIKASQVRNILLTGGTGHLGAHLLEQLLKIPSVNVVCLVRSSTQERAHKKLTANLKKYKLSVDSNRISIILGDVAKEQFGVSDEDYNRLSENMDAVYHLAAKVSFIENYMTMSSNKTDIRSVNVFGTINVLKFAANIKTKRVFYSSSIVAINKLNSDGFAYEEFPDNQNNGEGMAMGYSLTKFVSEQLIGQAISRGIPCIVIRYPNVIGNSQTGHFNVGSDFLMTIFLISIKLGVFFKNEGGWFHLSVDKAVQLTMDLLFNDDVDSELYNLLQPNPIMANDLLNIITELGYNLAIVSQEEFLDTLKQEGDNGFLSFFKTTYGSDFLAELTSGNSIMTKHFLTGILTDSQLSKKIIRAVPNICERIGSSYEGVKTCLLYAKASGILEQFGIFPSEDIK